MMIGLPPNLYVGYVAFSHDSCSGLNFGYTVGGYVYWTGLKNNFGNIYLPFGQNVGLPSDALHLTNWTL